MKTTLLTTLIIMALGLTTKLSAQEPCPVTNKMKEGSCLMIEYGSATAASTAVAAPAETLIISESIDESANGVYIAQYACSGTEVIFTKSAPCNCSGYEGVVVGKLQFTHGDMICEYDAAGVLPVDFSFFKAENQNDMAMLTWGTAMEVENEGFYLEKSSDGIFFQEFAFIVGEGNSTEEVEYEALDRDPFNGMNYYRLKQVDYNGSERFSKVVKLDLRNGEGVIVNYISDSEEISIRSQKTLQHLEVYDMAGVRVHRSTFDQNATEHSVSFSGQTSGHFVAVITDVNGTVETTKFVTFR